MSSADKRIRNRRLTFGCKSGSRFFEKETLLVAGVAFSQLLRILELWILSLIIPEAAPGTGVEVSPRLQQLAPISGHPNSRR